MRLKKFRIILFSVLLSAALCLFAACDEEEGGGSTAAKLGAPSGFVVQNGSAIWNKVEGAKQYSVLIVAPDGKSTSETVTAAGLIVKTDMAGDYKMSVKAVAGDASHTDSDYCAPVTVKKAPAPQSVRFAGNGSTLEWDAVEGAVSYTVKISNDGGTKEFVTDKNNINLTDTRLDSYGRFSVRVNHSDNVIASTYSKQGEAQSVGSLGIGVNAKSELEWNPAYPERIQKLSITIDGVTPKSDGGEPIENLLDIGDSRLSLKYLLSSPGSHKIVVTAGSNSVAYKDVASEIAAVVVGAPELSVEKGKLKISAADEAASSVSIVCNDGAAETTFTATKAVYPDITQLAAGTYSIRAAINPNSETDGYTYYLGSEYGVALANVEKLAAPTVSMSKGTAIWTEIGNTDGYIYKIDGREISSVSGTGQLKINLENENLAAGAHIVSVKSVAKAGNFIDSEYSTDVACVAQSPLNLSISDKKLVWSKGDGVFAYSFALDGGGYTALDNAVLNGSLYNYDLSGRMLAGGPHTVSLRSEPHDRDDVIPFVSQTEFDVYATPSIKINKGFITLDIAAERVLLTAEINGDSRRIELDYNNLADGYKLNGMEAGTYRLSACVLGDESRYFSSAFSAPITVTKLSAPTALDITPNRTLTWQSVDSPIAPTGYLVEIRNSRQPVKDKSFSVSASVLRNEIKVCAQHDGNYINSEWAFIGSGNSDGFKAGTGTAEDPFVIGDYDNLRKVADFAESGSHFVIVDNIYASGLWIPIANFNGYIDGAGYTIYDLNIGERAGDCYGFIASAENAVIKNLKFSDAKINIAFGDPNQSVQTAFGIIVGKALNSEITDCGVTGTISVSGANVSKTEGIGPVGGVGGIAGSVSGGRISDCSANIDIKFVYDYNVDDNFAFVGGIVGLLDGGVSASGLKVKGGSIEVIMASSYTMLYVGGCVAKVNGGSLSDSYSFADVSVKGSVKQLRAAGFAGDVVDCDFNRCGALGSVSVGECLASGGAYVAGFAGYILGGASGKLRECFSTGAVLLELAAAGNIGNVVSLAGFVGHCKISVENCYSTSGVRLTYISGYANATGGKSVDAFIATGEAFDAVNSYASGDVVCVTDDGTTGISLGSFCKAVKKLGLTACYYSDVNDYDAPDGATKLTSNFMKSKALFETAGWKVTDTIGDRNNNPVWYIDGTQSPVLLWAVDAGIVY